MFGSQGGLGGLPFGAGAGATATPADTRPPEERFQLQLQVRRFRFASPDRSMYVLIAHCLHTFSNCKTWALQTHRRM